MTAYDCAFFLSRFHYFFFSAGLTNEYIHWEMCKHGATVALCQPHTGKHFPIRHCISCAFNLSNTPNVWSIASILLHMICASSNQKRCTHNAFSRFTFVESPIGSNHNNNHAFVTNVQRSHSLLLVQRILHSYWAIWNNLSTRIAP